MKPTNEMRILFQKASKLMGKVHITVGMSTVGARRSKPRCNAWRYIEHWQIAPSSSFCTHGLQVGNAPGQNSHEWLELNLDLFIL